MTRISASIAVFVITAATSLVVGLATPGTGVVVLASCLAGTAAGAVVAARPQAPHTTTASLATPTAPTVVPSTPLAALPSTIPGGDITPTLRHDLRGLLSPALLCADTLTSHADEDVRRQAGRIVEALERTAAKLKEATPIV